MQSEKIPGIHRKENTRRKQILDAAMAMFLKKGFNGATTKEIAREAGVAEGTIYRYFKNKKELLLALAEPDIVKSLTDIIHEVSGQTDEIVFKAVIKNRLDTIKEKKDLIRLLLTEAQFHPEIKEKFVERIVLKAAAVLEGVIEERVEGGFYRAIDPQIAARAFVGMIGVFVIWKEYLLADKYVSFNDEDVINGVVGIFLNGVRKTKEKGDANEFFK